MTMLLFCTLSAAASPPDGEMLVPVIDGDWWQVAGDPDLGEYTTPGQQPVDFGVWQAADGTWQLWSCIRGTDCGGNTRLFYRWEGKSLTDTDWAPKGIAMEADTRLGETEGGLQAPHVVEVDGQYLMAYGDWQHICFATSEDGKSFTRRIEPDGKTGVFGEGPGANSRDAMLLKTKGLWHCYYTGFPGGQGYVFCRTSKDLKNWGDSAVVAYGGWAGSNPFSCECPHAVEPSPGVYYLFRTQRYGEDAQTSVYRSTNPLNFGINDDDYFVRTLPVAAPEIIQHNGQYYIAALMPNLKGIRIARLKWVSVPARGKAVLDLNDPESAKGWEKKSGNLGMIFTEPFIDILAPPAGHFITTMLSEDGQIENKRTGVIEGPEFSVEAPLHALWLNGGGGETATYVAFVSTETGEELSRVPGNHSHVFRRVLVDTAALMGQRVRLRIVDEDTGPGGFIGFGGLYQIPQP